MYNSSQYRSPGLSDVFQGLSRWRTWSLLGYYDFIGSYRKTTLGPIWQIVHVAAWILGLWLDHWKLRAFGRLEEIMPVFLEEGKKNAPAPAGKQPARKQAAAS